MKTVLKCSIAFALLSTLQMVSAAPIVLGTANLLGSNETPPTGSPATGSALLTLNGDMLTVSVTYSGLTGGTPSAAHIHCCTAPGTNTGVTVGFTGFPVTTSGTYLSTFNLLDVSVYNAAFVTANGGTAATAETVLLAGINSGKSYVNIHDATFPGGEIRGFVTPEPASIALMGLGLGFFAVLRKRLT